MNEHTNALVTISQALASQEMQSQLATMLPSNVPLDRFTEVTMMAIRQNPDILHADRPSLYDACLVLARRGLLPDKKEAALVVFSTNVGTYDQPRWIKQVQAMPMVEGIIKEMGKADVKVYANSVYANDKIRLWNDDDGQHILHEPVAFGDRGERIGCFAAGKMADGRTYVEAMSNEDIAKVRSRSKQKDSKGNPTGTWKSDPERMEQKSALHRLRKRIPILDTSDALQNLKDYEDESDTDLSNDAIPPEREPKEDTVSADGTAVGGSLPPNGATRRPRALQSVVDQAKQAEMPAPPTAEYEGDDII